MEYTISVFDMNHDKIEFLLGQPQYTTAFKYYWIADASQLKQLVDKSIILQLEDGQYRITRYTTSYEIVKIN